MFAFREICEKVKHLSTLPPFSVPYHNTIFDSISVSFTCIIVYTVSKEVIKPNYVIFISYPLDIAGLS